MAFINDELTVGQVIKKLSKLDPNATLVIYDENREIYMDINKVQIRKYSDKTKSSLPPTKATDYPVLEQNQTFALLIGWSS